MLWYSLEAPHRGASNEYPQHMFSWRNKKDISIFRMKKAPSVAMTIVPGHFCVAGYKKEQNLAAGNNLSTIKIRLDRK